MVTKKKTFRTAPYRIADERSGSSWPEETVGASVSAEAISSITGSVLPELEAWRNRSLDDAYYRTGTLSHSSWP